MARNGWAIKSGWRVVVLDVLGLMLALVVFALFHHVLPVYGGGAKQHIVSVGDRPTQPSIRRGRRLPSPKALRKRLP